MNLSEAQKRVIQNKIEPIIGTIRECFSGFGEKYLL